MSCDFLPEWARCPAHGNYAKTLAALPTRDGRRSGNAVVIGESDRQWPGVPTIYLVVTDAGNVMRLTLNEMSAMFYPPEYIMLQMLEAHTDALSNPKGN